MGEPCTPEALLKDVRGLRVAEPDLGFKPLLAKLQAQQPDLGAATKEVREALTALKAESEAEAAATAAAAAAAAAAPPAADEVGAPSNAALSLACIGCFRLPSDMDDEREKHPVCPKCVKLKVPTTYWCCVECPGNPRAWKLHAVYHKEVKAQWKHHEDGGVMQQRRHELVEAQARIAAQTSDEYVKLMAEGTWYSSKQDWRRAGRTYREAIALGPDRPEAYFNLGAALSHSGHFVEAAQWYLKAKERYPVGSELWARATAEAFDKLRLKACVEVAKPEWWNEEGLKALPARVARAAPNHQVAIGMRANVLSGRGGATWGGRPSSAAEFKEAAAYFDRSAAMYNAPAVKADRPRQLRGHLPQSGRGHVKRSKSVHTR